MIECSWIQKVYLGAARGILAFRSLDHVRTQKQVFAQNWCAHLVYFLVIAKYSYLFNKYVFCVFTNYIFGPESEVDFYGTLKALLGPPISPPLMSVICFKVCSIGHDVNWWSKVLRRQLPYSILKYLICLVIRNLIENWSLSKSIVTWIRSDLIQNSSMLRSDVAIVPLAARSSDLESVLK